MKLRKLALVLSALALAALTFTFVSTQRRDPASCAVERLLSSRGWGFEEIVHFSDARIFIAGNVSLASQELLTSITVWRGTAAETRLVYSNATHSLILVEGSWVSRSGGWRVEDTILYRLLVLAKDSPGKRVYALGDSKVVEFEGPCLNLCVSVFSELKSLAQSSAPGPEKYSGRLLVKDCTPSELVLRFEGKGDVAQLSYRITVFDAQVSAKP